MSGASDRRLTAFDKLLQRGERDPRTRSSGVGIDLLDVVPEWEAFVAAGAAEPRFGCASASSPRRFR